MSNLYVRPGVIEGFCGPMASGKSSALLKRVDPLRWMNGRYSFIGFKPDTDDRPVDCRSSENFINWIKVPFDNPMIVFDYLNSKHNLVAFDEAQFFGKSIVDVVLELQRDMKNVVFAGLDSDFRGEPFGHMKELMFYANELTKLHAICPKCGDNAYYTQRLVNGEPAHYKSKIKLIEGSQDQITYEPRCFLHHEVPGKKI